MLIPAPQQINKGKHTNPDHIQEVPEHRETHQPTPILDDQSMTRHLQHQGDQPDDAKGDMQPMGANQCEKDDRNAERPGPAPL